MDVFKSSSRLPMGERNQGTHFNGAEDLTDEVIIHNSHPNLFGSYSHIYKGTCYGYPVAIKVLRVVTSNLYTIRRELKRLREVWSQLDHPNIMPLYGYTKESTVFGTFGALISPFYSNGDAGTFLAQHGPSFTLEERKNMALKGIVDGIIYLHAHEPVVIHGDLKPANILIDDIGNVMICDFGLVPIFSEDRRSRTMIIWEELTTHRYMAPELVMTDDGGRPTTASDVYALGCVSLEFLFLQVPYHNRENNRSISIIKDIAQGIPPARPPSDLSGDLKYLWVILDHAWSRDVPSRLGASEMLGLFKPPQSL